VILTQTPLRISLAGGGTDDPTYAAEHGGYAITAAIDKHVYVAISDQFNYGYLLKYSETEDVDTIDDVQHPILREALRYFDIPPHVEIASLADIPSGTGLGSSAAFTVGLCLALSAYGGRDLPGLSEFDQSEAAYRAALIELALLKRPGGRQDHAACAMGGIAELRFGRDSVDAQPLDIKPRMATRLADRLVLFYTGYRRGADTILSTQTRDGLDEIKEIGYLSADLLRVGKVDEYGELLNDHWRLKRTRSPEMSNEHIDAWYDLALANGAIGGKLVGAGGGGFLLFVTSDKDRLVNEMTAQGLRHVPFRFDFTGTTWIAR
jgi:D-glycero-alpha-D-manno-heptose-7-phosphate kinase